MLAVEQVCAEVPLNSQMSSISLTPQAPPAPLSPGKSDNSDEFTCSLPNLKESEMMVGELVAGGDTEEEDLTEEDSEEPMY